MNSEDLGKGGRTGSWVVKKRITLLLGREKYVVGANGATHVVGLHII